MNINNHLYNNSIGRIEMYSFNKLKSSLCIISSVTFLSACGGGSEDAKTYTIPKVMSEVKTDLNVLGNVLPSTQSTNADKPVYRYTQIFSRENNQFKQRYKLDFDFSTDRNTFYQLEANYDEIINSTPNSIRLTEYKKNNEGIISGKDFLCSEEDNPCSSINIISSIDIKTGRAKLNFNNLLLSKSTWVNGQINTITLAGSVEGFLTEAPTKVQLPMRQLHELKWSTTPSGQENSDLFSAYDQLYFTNHNEVFLSLEQGSIFIKNNKVENIYFNPAFSSNLFELSCNPKNTPCQNATYNPNNYEVTFTNTKMQSTFFGSNYGVGYLNGSTGL